MNKILALFLLLAILLGIFPEPALAEDNNTMRISGSDRYNTSIEISNHTYPTGADAIIIASGENFSDALSASSLSVHADGPILLARKDGLSDSIKGEIERLNPATIYIVGGENTISSSVEEELATYGQVIRLAGQDRFDTSVEVRNYINRDATGPDDIIFVNGLNFPDALSAGSNIARFGTNIILTNGKDLPDPSLPRNGIIIGGEKSVNIPDMTFHRLAGSNRYLTSYEVAKEVEEFPESLVIASGENYPDALTSISLLNKEKAPLLLVKNDDIETDILAYIGYAEDVIIVGGEKSISKDLENTIQGIVGTRDTVIDGLENVNFVLNFPGMKEEFGWYTTLLIGKDGLATGEFTENLTDKTNRSDFTGKFDLVWKIDDYAYQLEYHDHIIVSETGTCIEVDYGTICGVDSTPGFTEGDLYNLYLPGAEYDFISQEVRDVYGMSEGQVLDRYALHNLETGEVFIQTTE